MTRRTAVAAAAVAAPFALSAGVALAATGAGALNPPGGCTPAAGTSTAATGAGTGPAGQLNATQTANARTIYSVGVQMGLPARAEIIAIATAMQESRLLDLAYGDLDSLGLFQQRPSQGWGAASQIMNPVYASAQFYDHLTQVPGWQSLPLTETAQAVQKSADPAAYAQWQPTATALVTSFGGGKTAPAACPATAPGIAASGTTRLPSWYHLPPGTPRTVKIAIAYALAQLGKPYIWGGTGPAGYDCSGLVQMAYQAAGLDIPRITEQQVFAGAPVPGISQLAPGDLLFTAGADGTSSNPGHVGMYIGDNLIIQAPQTGQDIQLSNLAGYWTQDTVAIRRIAGLCARLDLTRVPGTNRRLTRAGRRGPRHRPSPAAGRRRNATRGSGVISPLCANLTARDSSMSST